MFVAHRSQSSQPARDTFRDQVTDLRDTLAHLEELERQMTRTLHRMRAEGETRERMLVAEVTLHGLRDLLRREAALSGADQDPYAAEAPFPIALAV